MKLDLRELMVDVLVFGGIALAGYAAWRGYGATGLALPGVMLYLVGLKFAG